MSVFKRICAILMVVVLVGLYAATFVLGVSGSDYFMGMIFLDVVVPVLCWAIWLVARLLKRKGEDIRDDGEADSQSHQS